MRIMIELSPAAGIRSAFNLVAATLIATVGSIALSAQVPGKNVNMVSGTTLPEGDPFLQRQNEPSIAVSTRNPQHLLAGANDYRTVDLPGLPDDVETGDAWLGLYKSTDGGQTWRSTLLHGYPQDSTPNGLGSPLHGFAAAADPTVRAGANGLFFYSGIAFDRGENAPGAVFVARFSDDNNKENGDPFRYLGTTVVAKENNAKFLDKPWLAVDEPRGDASCTVNGHRVAAGAVYLVYTVFNGAGAGAAAVGDKKADNDRGSENEKEKSRDKRPHGRDEEKLRGRIMFSRSTNCGSTWSKPIRISSARDINQGSTIAIDPSSGTVYVAWRQFADAADGTPDAFMVTHSHDGRHFDAPLRISTVRPFDQGTTNTSFRTTAFPTMTIDKRGRVYVAWAARGFAAQQPDPATGDSRIVLSMSIASDGDHWSAPRVIDNSLTTPGHQIMPALAYAAGRLQLAYYDLREDVWQWPVPYVDDFNIPIRHTIDVRSAQAIAGPNPVFTSYSLTQGEPSRPSEQVSHYLRGSLPGGRTVEQIEQLDFNPPNLPLFKLGTVPFLGDYIDVAPAPAFVLTARGRWVFNTSATNAPVFHVVWTDNRDVRPPQDGDWAHYTPPTYRGPLLNAGQQPPACWPGQTGMRNQNIYTSQISAGLVAGSPGNTKPLSQSLQRGFAVFVRNATTKTRGYTLTVANQPPGGRASFSQFPWPFGSDSAPLTTESVIVPPLSMAARTVYVTSSDPSATIDVVVTEVPVPGGPVVTGEQFALVSLNPDITNPAITNPDITNADIPSTDINNAEVSNPAIINPAITNPNITNPAITNPDITNGRIVNPDITNPGIPKPDITNPAITNPDITNPAITNTDILNGSITDVTWTMTNTGNTAAAFSTKLFLASGQIPPRFKLQLVVYKTYYTPVAVSCEVKTESHTQLLVNVVGPAITNAAVADADLDPAAATFVVQPGEKVNITVRVMDPDAKNTATIMAVDAAAQHLAQRLAPAVKSEAVNSEDAANGVEVSALVAPPSTRSLAFVVGPPAVTAFGEMLPPVVVQMRSLAIVPASGEAVTLTLDPNPSGASLAPITVATDSNGFATFPRLVLTVPGTGYRLTASAPGVPPAMTQLFTITGPAGTPVDLSVTNTHSPSNPVVGGSLSYQVTVSNNGSFPATNVTLAVALPASASFVLATSSQGSCSHQGGAVNCSLGTVLSGRPSVVSIVLTPNVAQTVTSTAVVAAVETDPNRANNEVTDIAMVAPSNDGLIGIYDVSYLNNASGCSPSAPNPFNCSYMSGPILVDPTTTPAGDYRAEILQQLDPDNLVGGIRVWDGDATTGTQHAIGEVSHHSFGQIYLYAHDWYPWDNPPDSGWRVAVYRLSPGPVAPTNLVARSPQMGRVDLSWTDNSSNETEFEIGRGGINQAPPNLTIVDRVGANVTTFTLTDCADPGVSHHWYVRALNGPLSSEWLGPVGKNCDGSDGAPPAGDDTFENATLDPAWTIVNTQSGNIGLSTAQNITPGGQQSLVLSSTSGGQRWIILERTLGGLTHGTATISFYDTAPGAQTLYTNFSLVDSTTGLTAILGTQDFDAFCYKAMVYDPGPQNVFGPNASCGVFARAETSNIPRTLGWHVFSIQWDNQTVALSIDNQQVFQMAGTFNFDKIHLDLSGPPGRPNATYYFDDFSIRP